MTGRDMNNLHTAQRSANLFPIKYTKGRELNNLNNWYSLIALKLLMLFCKMYNLINSLSQTTHEEYYVSLDLILVKLQKESLGITIQISVRIRIDRVYC